MPTHVDYSPRTGGNARGNDDDRHQLADISSVFDRGTLVLIGCGAAKRDPSDPVDIHEASVAPKRDPSDPVDIHEASVAPGETFHERGREVTGPAWEAQDLYTSSYFAVKRELAETVSRWTAPYDGFGWQVLSAEHALLYPTQNVRPYEKSVEDLGDDPTNADHRVRNSFARRRPDGQEIVTEMDQWAARVAAELARWIAAFRDRRGYPLENDGSVTNHDVNTLMVLAGKSYVEPLRERGVFEYGIARMAGNPNEGVTLPVNVRFLFEEIDAGGIGDQMAWLSDAVDRINADAPDGHNGDQSDLGPFTGDRWTCDECGVTADESAIEEVDGRRYCEKCRPRGECNRCGTPTNETGHGTYPLCGECQTEYGGQIREPVEAPTPDNQSDLEHFDGGV